MSVLYLIPVPLSQEQDLSSLPQGVPELAASLRHFFCEDIRSARRFLRKCGYQGDFEDMVFCMIDRKRAEEPEQHLYKILQGTDYGLLSESGMPCIADPGNTIVMKAHELGIKVSALPGPNSILLTLAASGFNGQHFCFHGYLPVKSDERKAALKKLEERSAKEQSTQLFIETPYRNKAMLDDILAVMHPQTGLCIGIDLTLPGEQVLSHSCAEWKGLKVSIDKRFAVFAIMARDHRNTYFKSL
jgi:16S rRNA (cytidine1402-2'-O)-methyltransferase